MFACPLLSLQCCQYTVPTFNIRLEDCSHTSHVIVCEHPGTACKYSVSGSLNLYSEHSQLKKASSGFSCTSQQLRCVALPPSMLRTHLFAEPSADLAQHDANVLECEVVKRITRSSRLNTNAMKVCTESEKRTRNPCRFLSKPRQTRLHR